MICVAGFATEFTATHKERMSLQPPDGEFRPIVHLTWFFFVKLSGDDAEVTWVLRELLRVSLRTR
ncbi:MAG TPA: hypothetical protein DCG12_21050 [Planctomycetaceae bacterium]|nr:hypothetical protein [Planctomycetaceae bacterium]